MSETFLAAATQQAITAGLPAEIAANAMLTALRQSGVPARRLGELHWLAPGGDLPGAWLDDATHRAGLPQDLPAFVWPDPPLLDHQLLHTAARSIQTGQRDLVMLGQLSGSHVAVVLLASPAAVGRYNLAPRARLAALLALNAGADGLAAAAARALGQLAQRERSTRQPLPGEPRPANDQPALANILPEMLPSGDLNSMINGQEALVEAETEPEPFDLPLVEEINWLAACPPLEGSPEPAFPHAQQLDPNSSGGVLRWLSALIAALEQQSAGWGLLLSSQAQAGTSASGLGTLVERV